MGKKRDAFSQCHPAVNFLYLAGAISFGVVVQHPAYILAGIIGSGAYYLLLKGASGLKFILLLLPLALLIGLINPLFNTRGETVLFLLLGRPYTLESVSYGLAIGGIFLIMMLWFGCYSAIMSSDKFTSLFGNVIPALSLLLVMVLRMVPSFARKTRQITLARKSIGKGASSDAPLKNRLVNGATTLSALTDWALEGSITTADSMRARGYGCAHRTTFRIYRLTMQDWAILALMALLVTATLIGGSMTASFLPSFKFDPINWGFGAYCAYLLIPIILHVKEAITWHISISRI